MTSENEKLTDEQLDESGALLRSATDAVNRLELTIRDDLHDLREAILTLGASLLTLSRRIDDERKERYNQRE